MSLTEAENVFAGLHETGLNDVLTAFFSARPRFLNYRTSSAVTNVPSSPTAWTTVPVIGFPGVAGGIEYAVQFSTPQVDIHPESVALPPSLILDGGQIALRTTVRLTLLCRSVRDGDDDGRPIATPISAQLDVVAVGRVVVLTAGIGTGSVSFELLRVEIIDISPDALESVIECLVLTLLRAALGSFAMPISSIPAGAFSLNLTRGPEAETDQLKLYGSAV